MASRELCITATYLLILFAFMGVIFAIASAVTRQIQTINFADLPILIQNFEIEVADLVNTIIETLEKQDSQQMV